jgi:glycosyltransferase involved in cell wall biosynthesis
VPDPAIRARIHLPGPQPLATVQEALRGATIAVICSSGFESFSFSTLEAMAWARPIVGSRVGAIPELLDHGRCGLTVAPGNVAHFAEALDRLLTDRQLCEALGTAAHEKAYRCYDTAAALPQFIEVFTKARAAFATKTGRPQPTQSF